MALASHNQSFAQVADLFVSNNPVGSEAGQGGDSSKRGQKQRLLDLGMGGDSSSFRDAGARDQRGSSLFIKRVADLEDDHSGSKGEKVGGHFRDKSGQNIEMSE